MDADGLPIVGVGVDYTQVGPIHLKKTLALLNHFVTYTVNFLNKFASVCEEKLEDLNDRMQRMEATLCILEAKLSSIPGLVDVTLSTTGTESISDTSTISTAVTASPSMQPDPQSVENHASPPAAENQESSTKEVEPPKPTVTVSQDPRYAKYFKMVQVGVPAAALRTKMTAEGLNPDLLQNPSAPAPDGAQVGANSDMDSDNDSSSDFSD